MAADTIVTGSKLTAIANAIRSKTGGSSQMTLDQMATAIAGISATDRLFNHLAGKLNGSTYEGQFAYSIGKDDWDAILNSPAQGLNRYAFAGDKWVRDVTFPDDKPGITTITTGMFMGSGVRSITLPPRTDGLSWSLTTPMTSDDAYSSLNLQYFFKLTNLESVDISEATSIAHYSNSPMFYGCSKLTSLSLPDLTGHAIYLNQGDFQDCTSLTKVILPPGWCVTASGNTGASSVFANCTSLKVADLSADVLGLYGHQYSNGTFRNCSAMESLVLRATTMVYLNHAGLFGTDYNGGAYTPKVPANLTIYVPQALIASYEADQYWSTFAGRFSALENYSPSS